MFCTSLFSRFLPSRSPRSRFPPASHAPTQSLDIKKAQPKLRHLSFAQKKRQKKEKARTVKAAPDFFTLYFYYTKSEGAKRTRAQQYYLQRNHQLTPKTSPTTPLTRFLPNRESLRCQRLGCSGK